MTELEKTQSDYIDFLHKVYSPMEAFCYNHGYKASQYDVKKSKEFIDKIKELSKEKPPKLNPLSIQGQEHYKEKFNKWVKDNGYIIHDKFSDLFPDKSEIDFQKGELITYTNSLGSALRDIEILGFGKMQEAQLGKEYCVYLNTYTFWMPVKISSIKKQK